MVNILGEAQVFPNKTISFSTNSKYIFYIGKGWKIHRIDKMDFQDKVICDIKAMDVKCTEEGIFFTQYSKTIVPGYWDDNAFVQKRDVSKSSDLFFAKEDGTKLKCIMKRSA